MSEASRLQIGAANCNQRGAAQSNVLPLDHITLFKPGDNYKHMIVQYS